MRQYFLTETKKRQYVVIIGDIVLLFIGILCSYAVRIIYTTSQLNFNLLWNKLNPWIFAVILAYLLAFYLLDLYNINRLFNYYRTAAMTFLGIMLAGLLVSGLLFFLPKYVIGRQVLLVHLSISCLVIVPWRIFFAALARKSHKVKQVGLISGAKNAKQFMAEVGLISDGALEISGVCIYGEKDPAVKDNPFQSLSRHGTVDELIRSNAYDLIVFDPTGKDFKEEEIRLILQTKYKGKFVYDIPTLYKNLTGRIPLDYIDGKWLLKNERLQGGTNIPYVKAKRAIDVLLAMAILVLCAPLIGLIALMVKLDSKGPVFFSQDRLGVHKTPFKCHKFRTMVDDAEKMSGPVWSQEGDPRITSTGRWLRKTRLDELPQLWNILNGDMSFVGPRPIRDFFADRLERKIPFYSFRFNVKPGLSGWAQVNRGYAGTDEAQWEKFQYELFYILNMSFFLDLFTLFKTLHKFLRAEGT